MTITKNILHPPLFRFHNTNSTYSVHLICTSTCVSCKQLPVLFLSRVCWQYFSILRTFPGVVWQVHHTAICIKAGSQSKAFHNKDEMAEKTAILLWLIVYVISTFVLVTVEAVYKLYSIISPRRNMEADDDVDNDYRKYYATWCHACHDTTPSKHTHKMETLLTRDPDKGSTCTMYMCSKGHFISDRFIVHISRTWHRVGVFLQSSWCDFWGNKRAVHIREEKPDKQK